MKKYKIYYTITRHPEKKTWTLWENHQYEDGEIGGCGCKGIFTAKYKKDCIEFCKKEGIKYEK